MSAPTATPKHRRPGPAVVPVLTCPEGAPDYVECSCGNDPIGGLGFAVCDRDGDILTEPEGGLPIDAATSTGFEFIRCGECGAVYDARPLEDAEPGSTFEAVADV